MEERKEVTTSSLQSKDVDRGAGGKINKKTPFLQRPPPYARPQKRTGDGGEGASSSSSQNHDGGRGWWKSASRILSSFFSKSIASDAGAGDASVEGDIQTGGSLQDGQVPFVGKVSECLDLDAGNTLHKQSNVNELSDIELGLEGETISGQVPSFAEVPKCLNLESGNTISRSSAANEISEIEERLEGKTLSRDEFDRLRKILESRVAAQSDGVEYGNRVLDSATQADAVVASLSQERLKGPDDKNEVVYLNRVKGESSNPFLNSTPGDLVGASPIDIAKAYMGSRTSDLGVGSQSIILQGEITPLSARGFVSHSSALSPRPKSSVCWPGAMVQESFSYLTPQTQNNRAGLHTSQRTPYSRPVHSRFTSKLKGGGDRPCNILSTNMNQLQTPVYGGSQVPRTSISSLNDGFGSAGPIRRARRKFHGAKTPSIGMSSSHSTPFWKESLDASNSLSPMVIQSHEPEASTSSSSRFQPVNVKTPSNPGYSTAHPQSTDMAKKILEHLDRTIPTPEKKSAELKLATSWRKTSCSVPTTRVVEAPICNPHVESSKSEPSDYIHGQKFFDQEKEVRAFADRPQKGKADVNPERMRTLVSSLVSREILSGASAVPFEKELSIELKKTPELKTNRDEVSIAQDEYSKRGKQQNEIFPRFAAAAPNKKPPAFGNKPSLASISVVDPKSRIVNNNGWSGFTFPVSSGSLLEPPTPSMLPSSFSPIIGGAGPPEPKQNNTKPPTYSFGNEKGSRGQEALVFSFPRCNPPSDFSTPQFTFGSNSNKARICFRPVGEDAVC